MNLAVDTNRLTDLQAGVAGVAEVLESAVEVHVPFVVLGELRAGYAVGRRGRQNEQALDKFLSRPNVRVLLADVQTTTHFVAVFKQLRHRGTPIPDNDMWIAAMVIQHGLALYSRDAHFDHLPQIRRI